MSEARDVVQDKPDVQLMPLAGQVALVTGASRGIGQAIAQLLAKRGVRVVGSATSDSGADLITQSLAEIGLGCYGICLDVTDKAAVEAALNNLVQQLGGLHILVNNAGITRDTLALRMKDEDWDSVHETNLKGVYRLCQAAIRSMVKQRYGRIINITSVVGAMGNAGQVNYAAAKAGVAGLSRALARELGSRNITVNCVAPGFIETDMTKRLSPSQVASLQSQIPLGHLGQAQDVAHAVAFLASPEAGYITGIELPVNGGMLMV